MKPDDNVIKFINNFKKLHTDEIEDCFLYQNCYWFAYILANRFNGEIYYLPISNHFCCLINHLLYDIRGCISDVIELNFTTSWDDFQIEEPMESKRIIRDCINQI